jgi:hypothetical protein
MRFHLFRGKLGFLTLAVFTLFLSFGCNSNQEANKEDITQIAREAFVFAYPMLMGYQAQYFNAVDSTSPMYRAPFNEIINDSKPADHTRKDVVSMNADTPYTTFGLDLRAEPIVVSVPAITDRYYSFQIIDLFTHNFSYIGTRTTGTEAGDYLIVGPNWKEEVSESSFKEVIRSESELVIVIGRTQLFGPDDLQNVLEIQGKYEIQPLSGFLGEDSKRSEPLEWLKLNPKDLYTHRFINYFNFYLGLVQPIHSEDQDELDRFSKIGVEPGKVIDYSEMDEGFIQAIDQGVQLGLEDIKQKAANIGESVNGWNMMNPFGSREFYQKDRLLRAAAVMVGIYGNDKAEAFYPVAFNDQDGKVLDASQSNYQVTFSPDNIPPAKYFWSLTIYNKDADGVSGYLVENPIERYLINSNSRDLKKEADGTFTILIQHEKPDEDMISNWLPAPDGEFYLMFRLYGPEETAMNNTWIPPKVINSSR